MASAISFKVTGLDKLIKACDNFPVTLAKDIDAEIEDTCQNVIAKAKQRAPKDFGALQQMTNYKKEANGNFVMFSNARYAPFVEFGTRGKVRVPPELSSYAQQFKGMKWGDYYDFLNSILDWVKRKGLARITNSYTGRSRTKKADLLMVANAVAWSILKKGIKPQPFFFNSWFEERPKLGQRIKNILKNRGFR
jgi:HK97 gp10 family phage protein